MTSRERIKKTFNFEIPDRVGIFDAPWPETVQRWQNEGLPKNIHVNDYFDYDIDECVLLDASLGLPEKVIKKDALYVVFSNTNGVVHKVIRGQTGAPAMGIVKQTGKISPRCRWICGWIGHFSLENFAQGLLP
ncbi:MAG: hypothetical protein PHV34_04380 [Verrucomicrobiae bacterium]|nr:hypothetical protein [Verrucomicrobiae bacterium]